MVISPDRRRLKSKNVIGIKRRLKRFQGLYKNGDIPLTNIRQSIQAWIGHAKHANSVKLRELIFSDTVFRKERAD
jgi:hypothetical protein